jgi:hypothetical protein
MSREAMQMALEALESDPVSHLGLVHRKLAITALRQALVNADDTSEKRVDETAKQEHEPVAFINVEKQKLEWAKLTSWHTPTIVNLPKIPLYTAPTKREWAGLTDEEIAQGPQEVLPALYGRWGWAEKEAFEAVVAWAEAKLKEKNT